MPRYSHREISPPSDPRHAPRGRINYGEHRSVSPLSEGAGKKLHKKSSKPVISANFEGARPGGWDEPPYSM
jgi:hypothetical protein